MEPSPSGRRGRRSRGGAGRGAGRRRTRESATVTWKWSPVPVRSSTESRTASGNALEYATDRFGLHRRPCYAPVRSQPMRVLRSLGLESPASAWICGGGKIAKLSALPSRGDERATKSRSWRCSTDGPEEPLAGVPAEARCSPGSEASRSISAKRSSHPTAPPLGPFPLRRDRDPRAGRLAGRVEREGASEEASTVNVPAPDDPAAPTLTLEGFARIRRHRSRRAGRRRRLRRVARVRAPTRFLVSLPERLVRAVAALVGGTVHETAELVLPRLVRRSRLYEATAKNLLRITVELVGGVERPDEAIAGEFEPSPGSSQSAREPATSSSSARSSPSASRRSGYSRRPPT